MCGHGGKGTPAEKLEGDLSSELSHRVENLLQQGWCVREEQSEVCCHQVDVCQGGSGAEGGSQARCVCEVCCLLGRERKNRCAVGKVDCEVQ